MFFQISPGPGLNSKPCRTVKEENEVVQETEIAILTLAPFTPTPKISFQDVKVNSTQCNKLVINNPKTTPLDIKVTFDGPEELELFLSWNEKTIEAGSQDVLELQWSPINEYSGRHCVKITCQKQFWNVPISFKAISPKISKQKQKKKVVTSVVKKKSPGPKFHCTRNVTKKTIITSQTFVKKKVTLKENIDITTEACETFVSPTNVSFRLHTTSDDSRRYTYTFDKVKRKPIKKRDSPKFDDSLEINSPKNSPSPDNQRSVLTEITSNNTPKLEELLNQRSHVSINTPVSRNFRPRRYSTEIIKKKDSENLFPSNISEIFFDSSYLAQNNSVVSNKDEAQVTFNLSSEPLEKLLDSNTFIKRNLNTDTFTKDEHDKGADFKNFNLSPTPSNNEKLHNLSFSSNVSTSTTIQDASISKNVRKIKRKIDDTFTYSPPKRQNLVPQTWSKTGSARKCSMNVTTCERKLSKRENLKGFTRVEKKTSIIKDPFIIAATTSIDPFLTNTVHLDEEWITQQECRFKRWFNMLLTPPEELKTGDDNQKVDFAGIWKECSKKEVANAPTKEEISMKYHTDSKLNILRKSARELYMSEEIQNVLQRVSGAIECKKLELRQDRNLHLDLNLQSRTMSLLLSYNPLWLRIGLETLYGEIIFLKSNSDILGLSKFLCNRFFKDPNLLKKYKTVHNPKYTIEIKKFMLRKFIELVYFLDRAKMEVLIRHDPCLFRKNAEVKESRELLIKFSIEAVSAAYGDINKYLKYFGYVVSYKQTFIHEFDYAVNTLGGDLRDGIRLARVMEIISLRNDLVNNLRVPTISRLQKIHNVKLVFQALAEAGYEIQHEIEPYHIVDGHKEKTLSFLWQIIYKFQAPFVVETVRNIQSWWRSLPIRLKRNRLRKIYEVKTKAVVQIQKWYRRHKLARKFETAHQILTEHLLHMKRERNAVKIQSFFRMYVERKKYLTLKESIVELQRQCRSWLNNVYNRKRRAAAIIIQKNVRKVLARAKFMQLKKAVLTTEEIYIARIKMIKQREQYQRLKRSAIVIQRWYRANVKMRIIHNEYSNLRNKVCLIQKFFRNKQVMKKEQQIFQSKKTASIVIQKWYRSVKKTEKIRKRFLVMKKSVSIIEERYISYKLAKNERENYLKLKKNTIIIQRYLRATFAMNEQRIYYQKLRTTVMYVQTKYRAKKLMIKEKLKYVTLRKATICIQQKFRAKKLMRLQRDSYLKQKKSASVIQNYYKAYILMKNQRNAYLKQRKTVIFIQRKFKANILMRYQKLKFETLKKTTIFVQRQFRTIRLMRIERKSFLKKRNSCILIQNYYRSYVEMKKERKIYQELKKVTVVIQRRYKAKKMMLYCRENFNKLKNAVLYIQRKFRATRAMKVERELFVLQKKSAIIIQRYYRGHLLTKIKRQEFIDMRKSAEIIQRSYRKYKLIKTARYQRKLIRAVTLVQTKYRFRKLMKQQRELFLRTRRGSVIIQTFVRSCLLMKKERKHYLKLQACVRFLQAKFRAQKSMRVMKEKYESMRRYIIFIQRRFRANKIMKETRRTFIQQKKAAIKIQKYYRGYRLMKEERDQFLLMRSSAIEIQRFLRGWLVRKEYGNLLTPEAIEERKLMKRRETAAIKIQAFWKGYNQRRADGENVKKIRERCIYAKYMAQSHNTLENRGKRAMEQLENLTMRTVITALIDLEYVTRRSKDQCLSYGQILPECLYLIIESVGRSLPEVDICVQSIYIIINLYKFPPTSALTWYPEHLERMLTIMVHWCDKENMVFPAACTLIWLFAHKKDYKREILQISTLRQKLEKMKELVMRKQKMVMRSGHRLTTSNFLSAKSFPKPGLIPDWGFDYPKRPRIFINSVHAINCLVEILQD